MEIAVILLLAVVAIGMARYLITHDEGPDEPPRLLWSTLRYGVFAVIAAVILNEIFVPNELFEFLDSESGDSPPGSELSLWFFAISALLIGLIEETVKVAPLSFYIFYKRHFNEHADGVIYFALVGLCFGLIEDIMYTFMYGSGVGLLRILTGPYFHAATAGIFGYYLARYKVMGGSRRSVVGAYVAIVLLHALYDFGLFSGLPIFVLISIAITIGLNISLFYYYRRAQREDAAIGLHSARTVALNNDDERILQRPASYYARRARMFSVIGVIGSIIPIIGFIYGTRALIAARHAQHSDRGKSAVIGFIGGIFALTLSVFFFLVYMDANL